jgi:hypothetical protein
MNQGQRFLITLAAVLAFGPTISSAKAQTEINQCQLLLSSGSYLLTAPLPQNTPPPQPGTRGGCLIVAANHITIDLGGWSISNVSGGDNGITDAGIERRDIVVQNGIIRGFSASGVDLFHSTGVRVEHVQVFNNKGDGIAVGSVSIIKDNLVVGNSGVGINSAAGSHLVSGNIVTGNGRGITVVCPANISGNISSGNQATNLLTSGSGGCQMNQNISGP